MSLLIARRGVRATGSSFDIESDITWHSLLYSGSAAMSGYSDTDVVSTFYNSVSGEPNPSLQSGTSATYVEQSSYFNNHPTVLLGSGNVRLYGNGLSDLAQPFTILYIGRTTSSGVGDYDFTRFGRHYWQRQTTPRMVWRTSAGALMANTTGLNTDTDPHFSLFRVDSAGTDTEWIDDGVSAAGPGAGPATSLTDGGTITALNLGHHNGGLQEVVAHGIYDGDLEADAAYGDLVSWAETELGLTIA